MCDKCLAKAVGLTNPQQVNGVCAKNTAAIRRGRGSCAKCRDSHKITNALILQAQQTTPSVASNPPSPSSTISQVASPTAILKPLMFGSEEDVRKWVVSELKKALPLADWLVVHGKNVGDIIIYHQRNSLPLMLFIEVKYHRGNRIGIGHGNGGGYQPEYLVKKPIYLERYLRWLIVDKQTASAVWMSNDEVRRNLVGGDLGARHNNIRSSIFKDKSLERVMWDANIVDALVKRIRALI